MTRKRAPYRILLTDPAESDLVEVAAWYAERHSSGETRFFEAFKGMCEVLSQQPRIGRERPELRDGLRSWFVHPYVIFYALMEAPRVVMIERIIHGHMDIGEDSFDA